MASSELASSERAPSGASMPALRTTRRVLPDYDGRPDETRPVDILAWIPRVLLWPLQATFRYLLRAPLGEALTFAEREGWLAASDTGWGLVPTTLIDFGFLSSIGLYAWFDDVGAPGHHIGIQLGFGGLDWWHAQGIDRVRLAPRYELETVVDAWMRPDRLFLGAGPNASDASRARYGLRSLDADVRLRVRPWRTSEVRFGIGVSANDVDDTTYVSDDATEGTISDVVGRGALPGYALPLYELAGYVFVHPRLDVVVDSRERGLGNGSGVRIEAHAELAVDVAEPLARRWLAWGGAAGAFWDVSEGRTLACWIAAELVSPMGSERVPFPELPDFGTRGRMSGFRRGWIVGESVVAASLEYRYPIWVAVEGFVNVSIGNAFRDELAGFALEKLRTSYALGLRTIGDPDQSLVAEVGFGTQTFEDGGAPAVVRVTAGMQRGF